MDQNKVDMFIATMNEKWFLAGFLAAILTYKPQLVIGFILLWVIWKKFYPILIFILFSLAWQLSVIITKGINPYLEYLSLTKNLLYLPYIKEGFPIAIQSTPYALIASVISINFAPLWNYIYLIIIVLLTAFFGFLVYKNQKSPNANKNIILALAILLPLVISPYSLLHDLLILIPVIILLVTKNSDDRDLSYLAIGVYLSLLIIPLLSYISQIALTGLIPLGIFIFIIKRFYGTLGNNLHNNANKPIPLK